MKRKYSEKECKICHRLFVPMTPRQKYCGPGCAETAKKIRQGIHNFERAAKMHIKALRSLLN